MFFDVEHVIFTGVDIKSRRIYFGRYLPSAEGNGNKVDEISIEFAIRAIHKMVEENSKKPIEIHMNSTGGDPYSMLYLHDVIVSSPCQFKFYGGGAIMSAATIVMAVCDERYLYPNAKVMIHAGSLSFDSTFTEVEIAMDENKKLQDKLECIYAENSRMPKNFWTEVCKRDLYLTPEETIILGLADKIVEPKNRVGFRKERLLNLSKEIHPSIIKDTVASVLSRIKHKNIEKIELNKVVYEESFFKENIKKSKKKKPKKIKKRNKKRK